MTLLVRLVAKFTADELEAAGVTSLLRKPVGPEAVTASLLTRAPLEAAAVAPVESPRAPVSPEVPVVVGARSVLVAATLQHQGLAVDEPRSARG